MRKQLKLMATTVLMTMAMVSTAFAQTGMGNWQQNETGWWWQDVDGSYPINTWKWIDGNSDGIVESYYFDGNGYMLSNTTTPDGYRVNENGAWTENGVAQTQNYIAELGHLRQAAKAAMPTNENGQPVVDGNSIEKIVINTELTDMIRANGLNGKFPDRVEIGQDYWGPVCNVNYNGSILKIYTDTKANGVCGFFGPAKAMLLNIPEQGIELNAFYDNCGYESKATGRRPMASTGQSDFIFGLPTGTYRMAMGNYDDKGLKDFGILLTPGSDGKWYIYPDSPMHMY